MTLQGVLWFWWHKPIPVKVASGRNSLEEARDTSDAFVSKLTIKLSSDTYQWGCINCGPEEVLQKVSDCHVILTGLCCGLGSPAPALSNVMTKDGKAVKNPVLVMSVDPGLSEEITGSGLVEFSAQA